LFNKGGEQAQKENLNSVKKEVKTFYYIKLEVKPYEEKSS
jgi:hypothetical protein